MIHQSPRKALKTRYMTWETTYDSVDSVLQNKQTGDLVSLDIEGAFDNAWWPAIKCRLMELVCLRNLARLLKKSNCQRELCWREKYTKNSKKGCFQGSIGGPLFWNLRLDKLLCKLHDSGAYVHAVADEVVLVFSGNSSQDIKVCANRVLARVHASGIENKLNFAPYKTCSMNLTRKRKYNIPSVCSNGTCAWMVIEPIVMYASSVWVSAVAKISCKNSLTRFIVAWE